MKATCIMERCFRMLRRSSKTTHHCRPCGKARKRIFLWVEEDNIPLFIKQSGGYHLARSGGKLILMNRALPRNQ